MNTISDEIIMAYVDGQLDIEQTEKVRKAIDNDPALQERATVFRESASALEGVFDAPIQEEVPERLLDVLQQPERLSIASRLQQFVAGFSWMFQPLPAGAFALIALAAIGFVLSRQNYLPQQGLTPLFSGSEFTQILETVPSGKSVPVIQDHESVQITPVLTFQDSEQRFCRQFEFAESSANTSTGQGIACRDKQGSWEIVVVEKTSAQPQHPARAEKYELAGVEGAVDSKANDMRKGKPMSLLQEGRCIRQGWHVCVNGQ